MTTEMSHSLILAEKLTLENKHLSEIIKSLKREIEKMRCNCAYYQDGITCRRCEFDIILAALKPPG